jgi:hypothetical protein
MSKNINFLNLFKISDLTFPKDVVDPDFIDLTRKMLDKSSLKRLCSFEEIKKHNFFKRINFDNIELMSFKPPFIPNFDSLNYEQEFVNFDYFINVFFI